MYTPTQALEAIKARISGEWDNPELLKLGALHIITEEDILRIIQATDTEKITKVLFLKETDPGNVLAVFPDQVQSNGMIACYSAKEQHSASDKGYLKQLKQAHSEDAKELYWELKDRDYYMEILNGTQYEIK